MKKRILALALCCAMVFGLAACGKGNSGKDATSVLKINLASEPAYLDPALNSSVDGGCLAVNSFAGLYTYSKDNQELVPQLAKAMPTVSEDGKVYTVDLIESKWSNGEELTAKDFVYSWNRVVAEETAADYAYLFDIIDRNEDGTLKVEATNDYQLQITLTSPCPYFNDLMAFPTFFPVYQAGVEAADPDGKNPGAWAQEPGFVCNGAYTLTDWQHESSMTYTKNPNYYDADNVKIETLNFMLSADSTATYAAYQSGDLDFIDDVPTDEIPNLKDNPEFYVEDNLGTYYAAFNVNADLFKNMTADQAVALRKAISLVISRNDIVEKVGQTGQVPASSFVPEGMADGNGSTYEIKEYYKAAETGSSNADAVAEATKTLTDAGFTLDGGVLKLNGEVITVPYVLNDNPGHKAAAEIMQQDLKAIGIDMSIETQDWQVFLDNRKAGKYTFAREGWLADYNDPVNMLEIFTTDSGNNDPQLGKEPIASAPQNWSEYDALINEIRTTTDFAKRVDLMHQAEDMLMDTYAVVPIYYYNDIYMQKANVTGVYTTVYGMKYFMYAEKAAQ
jgi:peptide/nickel transport system substrate-binding protein/oligopeptide transport system substrate-binding protein